MRIPPGPCNFAGYRQVVFSQEHITNGRDLLWHVSNDDRTLYHGNGKGIVIIVPLLLAVKFFVDVRAPPIFVNVVQIGGAL